MEKCYILVRATEECITSVAEQHVENVEQSCDDLGSWIVAELTEYGIGMWMHRRGC